MSGVRPTNRRGQDVLRATTSDFQWRPIWIGVAISGALSVVVGLPLTLSLDNVWWVGWVGVAGLFIGGFVAARIAGTSEPLNGAMIALLYFAVIAVGYLVGQALEWLPDPLPGLAPDNSTFFFVWPLTQIVAGTVGSLLGGPRRASGR